MNAVIYVCHGSRVPAGREQAVNFIKRLMKHNAAPIQEYCFLEFAEPTIEEAFIRTAKQGAAKIIVIPVLLLTAAHAKKDIPDELIRIAIRYPEIEVIYGSPIGVHVKMVQPIMESIHETGERLTENSIVLLAGRGSSDPDVKRDLNKMAEMLKVNTSIRNVETCFLTSAAPSFETALKEAGQGEYDKVFVIPYLLFTGLLIKHIKKVIETNPNREKYFLCNYLGHHPCIEEILLDKVNELLKV